MPSSSSQALLLVDGYNVIGAWSSLKQTRDRHGLDLARQDLVESLINYTAHQGYQTQVVFDAHYQQTPSFQEVHTPNLSVYYTAFAQTADSYIEKLCASLRHQNSQLKRRIIVATSDRDQQHTVVGYGAELISALKLEREVEMAAQQVRRKHRAKKPSRRRFLFDSLDAKAQQRLVEWRQGIY